MSCSGDCQSCSVCWFMIDAPHACLSCSSRARKDQSREYKENIKELEGHTDYIEEALAQALLKSLQRQIWGVRRKLEPEAKRGVAIG